MTLADYVAKVPDIVAGDLKVNTKIFKGTDTGIIVTHTSGELRCVVIRDREDPLVIIGDFIKGDLAYGFYPKLESPVIVHRHNDGDPQFPDRCLERVSGIAWRLFSFKTDASSFTRFDVLKLPKHFPIYHNPRVSMCQFDTKETDLKKIQFLLAYKKTGELLKERGFSFSTRTFMIQDPVENSVLFFESTLEKGDLDRSARFYREQFKAFFPHEDPDQITELYQRTLKTLMLQPCTKEELKEMTSHEWSLLNGKKGRLFWGTKWIAKGSHKIVFKGVLEVGDKTHSVAIAAMYWTNSRNEQRQEEFDVLQALAGAVHVIQVYSLNLDNGRLVYVTPLCHFDLQKGCDQALLNRCQRVDALRQSAIGLRAYHRTERIYSDVKPENILVTLNGEEVNAFLSDFEGGKKEGSAKRPLGSPLYFSPDLYQAMLHQARNQTYLLTVGADSWSFAKMAAYALSHKQVDKKEMHELFRSKYSLELYEAWIKKGLQSADFFMPGRLRDVLKRGFNLDPTKRPTMEEYSSQLQLVMDEMKDS